MTDHASRGTSQARDEVGNRTGAVDDRVFGHPERVVGVDIGGPRIVEILAFPSVQLLDVTFPLQVFATANDLVTDAGGAAPYVLTVVAQNGRSVAASAGVFLETVALPPPNAEIDTLLVSGGQDRCYRRPILRRKR